MKELQYRTQDEVLANGSILRWSKKFVKQTTHSSNHWIPVICGSCKQERNACCGAFQRDWGKPCSGLCNRCAMKLRSGTNHSLWKGRLIDLDGYILINKILLSPEELVLVHSMLSKSGYILEHRLVMAKFLKRPLQPNEIIHHLNGNKQDNRLQNLMVVNRKSHNKHNKAVTDYLKDEIKRLQLLLTQNNIPF